MTKADFSKKLSTIADIQYLFITIGFGHLACFQDYSEQYIHDSFEVNTIAPICTIRYYYDKLLSKQPFYCAIMVSIAGRLNSPMFSIYSATKAALRMYIEAINVELEVQGSCNKILEVSPGMIEGTAFYGKNNNPEKTRELAYDIIAHSECHEMLFIPKYKEVYKDVIRRYQNNAHQFGIESYEYKQKRLK